MQNINTTEAWKTIPGFDGLYEVSNQGRVRSWYRKGRASGRAEKPTLLAPARKGGAGGATYPFVMLYPVNGPRQQRYVHHLVAEAFIGPRPLGQQVAHNDGNPENNSASNLRYATAESNSADKRKHGTLPAGESHPSAKLNNQIVSEIRSLAGTVKQTTLAERFGVTPTTIGAVINNKTWKAA